MFLLLLLLLLLLQVTSLLSLLTPSLARLAIVGQKFSELCSTVEPWYEASYHTAKIEQARLDAWAAAPLHPDLFLPDRNPYIPSHFHLADRDTGDTGQPCILHQVSHPLGTFC